MTANRLQSAKAPDLSIEGVVVGDAIVDGPDLRGWAFARRSARGAAEGQGAPPYEPRPHRREQSVLGGSGRVALRRPRPRALR